MAEILLAYKAIFIVFDGSSFGELLNLVEISSIIFKILSWSPYKSVFIFGRSGETVLLKVGNCLIFFIGSFAKSFNLGIVI